MRDLKIRLLFELYLLGRKIRKFAKHQNHDRIFEATILNLLSKNSFSISEIARKVSTEISSASEKIMTLEGKGLVKKIKSKDQRKTILELTKKGKNLMGKFHSAMADSCVVVLDRLSEDELKQMTQIVRKLNS